jgi:hypothetical protein
VAEDTEQDIRIRTRKGSAYFTNAFIGYRSLRRYGKRHTITLPSLWFAYDWPSI